MRKDKEKVVDEVWTEGRIREFLTVKPIAGTNEDFYMLLKSYQAMRADDFADFLEMFLAEKRDINATDNEGRTLLSYVKEHRNSAEYRQALQANGAK